MNEIIIATKNKGKVKEFEHLFKAYDVKVKSLLELNEQIPDIEETGNTFRGNARLKAEQIAKILNKPVLADDSGLAVDALAGAPGVFSARYAGEPTDDKRNYEKVLEKLKNVPENERSARFVSVLAFAIPGEETIFEEGHCEGEITRNPAGENGFGYDPIFIPQGYDVTMAQLEDVEKNKISHRYHALVQMKSKLHTKLIGDQHA